MRVSIASKRPKINPNHPPTNNAGGAAPRRATDDLLVAAQAVTDDRDVLDGELPVGQGVDRALGRAIVGGACDRPTLADAS
jgi:hypothetical protein